MKKHAWAYLVAVALVGLFFAQAAGNLSAQSPVVDEPSHITRAIAYWRVGDLRLQLGHPPLIHALAGLPLLLEPGIPQLTDLPGWQPLSREELNGHALWDEGRPTDRIVFLARWPVLMLGVLLGALIFRWAGERFGVRAAVMARFIRLYKIRAQAGRDRRDCAVRLRVTQDARRAVGKALAVWRVNECGHIWVTDAGAAKKVVERGGNAGRPADFAEDHRPCLKA